MSIFLPKPEFEMIVPEPKIIKSWSDFDGKRTEKYYLSKGGSFLDVKLIDNSCVMPYWSISIYTDELFIPEAILILNSLGFNFKEGEA